ncbi:MAG: anthranilate/aminodeoxychorismate synthase component II [Dehalococcoidia bacterium]|nr:anthranilate/aminodeoxychorismate synthase component II [Dehalococcoidia bacterium]MQG16456.1 aminodeoxychorismate/anthranilate synthase component II [SAR202 cluster bacterium]|tara:strand:+ start:58 stop:633 length:576 start_codon:yes stop_codon:yes gene_type:complete
MNILIDNYDSFTYNIYQYMCELGAEVEVIRNDKASIEDIAKMKPEKIIISPGPCNPDKAGISTSVIDHFRSKVPILGVCLGHQCVGQAFGAIVGPAGEIMHGKTSYIHHDGKGVFTDIPSPFAAIRYHSLSISREKFPNDLEISAWTENGIVMGVRHKSLPIEGVQFHPESIKTEYGKQLLQNFLSVEARG